MRRKAEAFLFDILGACDDILSFIGSMDADSYAENNLVRSAVERKCEIIGEAISQLAKLDPGLAQRISDWREVIAFRNILIHGYATINHDIVWSVIEDSLPALRQSIAALLQELSPRE
jgi:uncharacterized protein with HEPN domain